MDENAEGEQPIANLLHELRQPLNTIILSCTNIQNRLRLQSDITNNDYVIKKTDAIMNSISQAAKVIDQIESISKKT